MKHLDLERKDSALIVFFLSVIALLIVLALNSCTKPTDHISLIVNESSLAKSPVLLHFSNANTSSTVQPGDFSVSISGKDSALVQMDGGITSNFAASHGFLPLSLIRSAMPSPTNPLTFNISAQIPGFAPVVQTVSITSDSSNVVEISAVEYANPAPGTAVLLNQSALTNGVSNGTSLYVPASAGMVESARVTIPMGTQMLDVSGSAINASQLKSNIVDYSAVSTTSYRAFPGGFSPTNVIDSTGNQVNGGQPINFVSAGLISIKMTAGTTAVRHFSKPLSVSMKLDPNTTNLITGTSIQAGDEVPLWSLTEETGQWKSEGNVTITNDGSGNLVANFTTTHLCCFNLDWSWSVKGHVYNTCNVPLKVTFHCAPGTAGIYDIYIVTPSYQYLAGAHGTYVADGLSVTFPAVPAIAQCMVTILNFTPALHQVGQTGLFRPCLQRAIDLNFTAPPPSSFINVSFNITGRCSSNNIKLLPTAWFYIYDDSGIPNNPYSMGEIHVTNGVIDYEYGLPTTGINGSYNVTLISGHKYHIGTLSSGKWYASSEFTMGPQNFSVSNVSGLSCSGVYDKPSNATTITAVYTIQCH
jgi:hypothetical protein